MIPRFKPMLGKEELCAIFSTSNNAVEKFEKDFATKFGTKYGLSFSYGRSALWSFFNALNVKDAEVILPAYTCSVVAHAIVLSGNIPRFVDINLSDYNMDLDLVERSINEKTQAVVATHLFGYPLNVDSLNEIVKHAEQRFGHKIWIIQDCAHSFGARYQGKLVCNMGDAAIFGLNISKTITSIFGGILLCSDEGIYNRIKSWRDNNCGQPRCSKSVYHGIYLGLIYLAFNKRVYRLVNWLQEMTPLLNRLTKAYHLDEKIHFPPDFNDRLSELRAKVGLVQLKKYDCIIEQRVKNAKFLDEYLPKGDDWVLPPIKAGATYSHYVVRVPNRHQVVEEYKHKGIQLGQLIDYSIPEISAYKRYAFNQKFPNSNMCSKHMINFPIYMENAQLELLFTD